jgi:guanine deaminase
VRIGLGTDVGGGTSFSMLRTQSEAYKVVQVAGGRLSSLSAFYHATLGGARALYLEHQIGNFAPGKEGDFAVLDLCATPLMARRMNSATSIEERLFAVAMLGDDRNVVATHLMGIRQSL